MKADEKQNQLLGAPVPRPPQIYLTRVYRFSAGHRLFHSARSSEWNLEIYGKCSYPGGHGHNYALEVTVRGTPDPDTGWVLDIRELDQAVESEVLEPIDHRNLNDVLELLAGPTPTTEVLIHEIWKRLDPAVPPPARLHRLRIRETSKNTFEYQGPA